MSQAKRWGLLWMCLCWWLPALAHDSLPASLILAEQAAGHYEVTWRVAQSAGNPVAITPVLPASCRAATAPLRYPAPGATVTQWTVDCAETFPQAGLVRFDGLAAAGTDVLVRLQHSNGRSETRIARPREPSVSLASKPQASLATWDYLGLGVEHIIGGFDHLLFVLCLMLLVPGYGALLKTITAFTVAHSLTLALASLQWVRLPQPPVEALIVLSILFLASEAVLQRQPTAARQAAKRPRSYWGAAFAFGLLHGFGFAGALAELGLPPTDIAPALLLFNLGVEAGQLLFIVAALPVIRVASRLGQEWPRQATMLPLYAVGSVAGFWFVQRMGTVFGLAA